MCGIENNQYILIRNLLSKFHIRNSLSGFNFQHIHPIQAKSAIEKRNCRNWNCRRHLFTFLPHRSRIETWWMDKAGSETNNDKSSPAGFGKTFIETKEEFFSNKDWTVFSALIIQCSDQWKCFWLHNPATPDNVDRRNHLKTIPVSVASPQTVLAPAFCKLTDECDWVWSSVIQLVYPFDSTLNDKMDNPDHYTIGQKIIQVCPTTLFEVSLSWSVVAYE